MRSSTDQLFDALAKQKRDIEEIRRLIQLDIDWKQTVRINNGDYTPLHRAAFAEYWEAVEMMALKIQQTQPPVGNLDLIEYGATVTRAVKAKKPKLVQFLLTTDFAKKSNKYAIKGWYYLDPPQDGALHIAIRNNDTESLNYLLDYGYSLNIKNDDVTPTELAYQIKKLDCLVEIAARTPLSPLYFDNASGKRLLNMMLRGIRLTQAGYQAKELQEVRGKVLEELLNLPDDTNKIAALRAAKDKKTLLGDYLLNYKRGFFTDLFDLNPELSVETMEKRIDARILTLKRTRATSTELYKEFDIGEASSDEGVELVVTAKKPASDSEGNTVESTSLDEEAKAEESDEHKHKFEEFKL